jgi:guanylate kinase
MMSADGFAEHAVVFANQYGTAKAPIESTLATGRDMIFDVDWQGGGALSTQWPRDSLKIFILPPDLATLADRLRRRATDAPDVIERRLRKAIEELTHFNEYDHLIVNDDLERAYQVLRALYLTRRYGVVDRPDLPFSLTELVAVVEANRARPNAEHARTLIADASGPVTTPASTSTP